MRKFYLNKQELNSKENNQSNSNNVNENSLQNASGSSTISKDKKLQIMNKLKLANEKNQRKDQKVFNYNIFSNNVKRNHLYTSTKGAFSKDTSPEIKNNNLSTVKSSGNTSSKAHKIQKKNLETNSKDHFYDVKKNHSISIKAENQKEILKTTLKNYNKVSNPTYKNNSLQMSYNTYTYDNKGLGNISSHKNRKNLLSNLSNQQSFHLNTNDSCFYGTSNTQKSNVSFKKDGTGVKVPKTGFYNDDRQPGYNYQQHKLDGSLCKDLMGLNSQDQRNYDNLLSDTREKIDFKNRSQSKSSFKQRQSSKEMSKMTEKKGLFRCYVSNMQSQGSPVSNLKNEIDDSYLLKEQYKKGDKKIQKNTMANNVKLDKYSIDFNHHEKQSILNNSNSIAMNNVFKTKNFM